MSITWINTDPCSYNPISRLSLRELPTYYSLAISISFHFLSPEIYNKKINMQLLLCIGLVACSVFMGNTKQWMDSEMQMHYG